MKWVINRLNECSMSHSFIGLTDWVCHIGTLTPCIEAVA